MQTVCVADIVTDEVNKLIFSCVFNMFNAMLTEIRKSTFTQLLLQYKFEVRVLCLSESLAKVTKFLNTIFHCIPV